MKTNGAKSKRAYRWVARVYAVEQCDGVANRVFQLRFSVICRHSSSPLDPAPATLRSYLC
jgi:hypothetical protein